MRAILALAVLAAVAPAPAPAAPAAPNGVESRYTPAYARCLDAPQGQSTAGMIQCTGQEQALQDARLNAQYRKVMAALNARQSARLQAAERAWIAYRDAQCRSLEDEDWGSLSRIQANACVLELTVERLIALEDYPPQ